MAILMEGEVCVPEVGKEVEEEANFLDTFEIGEKREDEVILKRHLESCKDMPKPTTLGVRAIYSIVDFSGPEKGGKVSKALLNLDAQGQPRLNTDFEGVEIPLYTMVVLYVILTAVEILISISGLAYIYEQAPDSLKAFISSLWLVPVALGNILVTFLNHIEMFMVSVSNYFAFNIGFSIFIFCLYIYVTVNYETKDEYFARKKREEDGSRREAHENLVCDEMMRTKGIEP